MSRKLRVNFFSLRCFQNLCFGPAGLNSRGFKTATTIVWTLQGQNLEFSFIYSLDFFLIRMGPGYLT